MAKEHRQGHRIRPEDVVIFVELDDFTKDWQDLRLSDDDPGPAATKALRR